MKIVLIGANHAGTSFIRTLKTLDKNVEITAYDRNTNVSFLGCGIAVWVSGEFTQPEGLFYSSPEILTNKYGVNLKTSHDVVAVDRAKKQIKVKNLTTGEEFTDSYDKLIYAGGTWPITPRIKGLEYNNIVVSKLFQHAETLVEHANDSKIKNVVVVGAGYIGTELVEAFHQKGKNVTLVDTNERVVNNYFDSEFTKVMEQRMQEDGVKLALGETVQEFESNNGSDVSAVITNKGKYEADLVIMCIGFRPNTTIIDADKTANGAIKVNKYQQILGDENVYAIGDSCATIHTVTGEYQHVALATNAVKTGVVAALHLAGANIPFPGVAGTNAINVFNCHYSSTGFTEEAAKRHGIENVGSVYFEDNDRPEFMSTAEKVACKVVYDTKTFKLLGVQIGSWGEAIHTETIYMFALAIQKGLTLPELALTDVYFLPHFNKPFNFFLVPMLKALGLDYKY
ncbi:FAD-dependent oxidoreductase [Mycoplasma sp. 1331]|uniref:FAD-dependent oxidoreductase n=1 Tax=Mycoplasma tauri TaxID=547987 RepID=A0A953T6Z6_9MOLU|nr:FAD-dependent oxidoreductase [Mycoplasma tauri]MBZ4195691.1 FAD-dependent oxidoreductase [Mycoplasma tauri]